MRKSVVSAARSAFLATLCLAGIASVPAAAEDVTVYVNHSDLNLSSAEGVKTLEARIAAAVKSVCARPETILDLKAMSAWESCKADASAKALAQIAKTVELARL